MAVRATTTVITAASTYDLVTLAIVKDELGIAGNGSDARLQRYIASVSAAIAQACNRVFPAETVADRFEIERARLQFGGENALMGTRWPLGAITSVIEDGTTLVQNTDYRIEDKSGLFYRLSSTSGLSTTWCTSPVVATYVGGYATIPVDVQDAAIKMIRSRWFAKDRDPLARSVAIPGVMDVAYWIPTGNEAGNMSPDVVDVLDNYRVPNFG